MGDVAGGAGEAIINMTSVLVEAAIRKNLRKVVTLAAHRVRAIDAQVGGGIKIRQKPARRCSLTELITPFQNVAKS
jgi:hypothetical protein